ncbi:acetoin utilization protein AcuC [Paenibacillus sp. HB172176]|uniref:acetoin utilization protein AcuC n=1 Tax=Paenibacillus sp. HB172176 TaxID=2493690 RepID=UPI0014392A38|nr:acetoin utilization protein AcuC [Paenibacillus sp. HB172176]
MPSPALFIHHPEAIRYKFHADHPFDPIRQTLTMDLLQASNGLSAEQIATPNRKMTDEALTTVHREDYVRAVKSLSEAEPPSSIMDTAAAYGLSTEDTPLFTGMHEAAAAIATGSLTAAETVMSGQAEHAFHLAGGLHHAFPERAAGFCVYNDAAIAIKHIRETYHARVLYVDTDVHHGDGVQWIFYDDPNVCTYSIHETGKFLFPGTGFVSEKGIDLGHGACFNMPLEPYTEDESWLESFSVTLRKVIGSFKPDVIISQHGCDAHAYDPLSHIHCSMGIYKEIPAILHELAHVYADGRWIALGGGGYDSWRVVPRAWSMVWLEMSGHPLAAAIRSGGEQALPSEWLAKWQPQSPVQLPRTWLEDTESIPPMPRRHEITEKNRLTQAIVIQDL